MFVDLVDLFAPVDTERSRLCHIAVHYLATCHWLTRIPIYGKGISQCTHKAADFDVTSRTR